MPSKHDDINRIELCQLKKKKIQQKRTTEYLAMQKKDSITPT